MNYTCPQCHQPVETGAVFCGNCGTPLQSTQPVAPAQTDSVVAAVYANQAATPVAPTPTPVLNGHGVAVPAYALPVQHPVKETKTVLAIVFGAVGIVGSLLIPISGLVFGVVSLVLSTSSRRQSKKAENTVAIVVGVIALILSVIMWVVAINYVQRQKDGGNVSGSSVPAAATNVTSAATSCYSAGFTSGLTVVSNNNTCETRAYSGTTFKSSNNVYIVLANTVPNISVGEFTAFSKQAIEHDFTNNLPKYRVTNERIGTFAGSPAYFVTGSNGNATIVEALVLHQTMQGSNVFTLLHGQNGSTVDLNELESSWLWGDN